MTSHNDGPITWSVLIAHCVSSEERPWWKSVHAEWTMVNPGVTTGRMHDRNGEDVRNLPLPTNLVPLPDLKACMCRPYVSSVTSWLSLTTVSLWQINAPPILVRNTSNPSARDVSSTEESVKNIYNNDKTVTKPHLGQLISLVLST